MSRLFGTGDQYQYADTAGWLTQAGAKTLMAVVKIATTADNTWGSIFECELTAANILALIRDNAATSRIVCFRGTGSTQSSLTITDGDGWCLIGWSIAAGTSTPRIHKIPIGGSPSHEDGAATLTDSTNNIDQINIGIGDDPMSFYLAAAAVFNANLSDANWESINTAKTTQSIIDLSPVWCVDDSDSFATNLGTSADGDRTGTTGSPTDSADDPTGWTYLGGAPPPPAPSLHILQSNLRW